MCRQCVQGVELVWSHVDCLEKHAAGYVLCVLCFNVSGQLSFLVVIQKICHRSTLIILFSIGGQQYGSGRQ